MKKSTTRYWLCKKSPTIGSFTLSAQVSEPDQPQFPLPQPPPRGGPLVKRATMGIRAAVFPRSQESASRGDRAFAAPHLGGEIPGDPERGSVTRSAAAIGGFRSAAPAESEMWVSVPRPRCATRRHTFTPRPRKTESAGPSALGGPRPGSKAPGPAFTGGPAESESEPARRDRRRGFVEPICAGYVAPPAPLCRARAVSLSCVGASRRVRLIFAEAALDLAPPPRFTRAGIGENCAPAFGGCRAFA